MTRVLLALMVVGSSVAQAQALRNKVERAKDRQDLRQDRRQLGNDRADAFRVGTLLADYDRAAAANDAARLGALDAAFNRYLAGEIAESKVESAQKRQEVREDKGEIRSDRREVGQDVALGRRPGVVADDKRDLARDRGNLADDRRDAAAERLSRERLVTIQSQLAPMTGRFDAGAVQQKRALYAEVLGMARAEIAGDKAERREDHRELREDRKETREDRRDPIR